MREVWLDYLRVSACLLVMVVHSTEPFYLGGEGGLILSATDAYWVAAFEALARCCVPVFLIASSYLQFPLHYSTGEFFKRRAVRILVPMLLWTLVYALVWGEPVDNLKGLLLNFNYAAGHLWFVYMLVGVYLIMPLLSPWAEKVSRRELEIYLGIWVLTLLFPFIREGAGGLAPIIQAADGLPAQAQFPLWGEASWNTFGLFYYLSGFIGYLLLGFYLRKFLVNDRWTGLFGWTLFLMGFVALFFGTLSRMSDSAAEGFPVSVNLAEAIGWETAMTFCGLPVALSAIGLTLAFRSSCHSERSFYRHVILPLSKAGYGMYLSHMLVLGLLSAFFRGWLGLGDEGVLGVWTTPVEILLTALCSFTLVGLLCVLVQRIPRVGRYLMG